MQSVSRQFRYILAAAREGSITSAAEAESISASSILSAIEKFEAHYKTQLFVRRRSKGLTLTATGERILSQMRNLMSEMESFDSALSQTQPTISGELRVGVFVTMAGHVMPYILKAMNENYPGIHINHLEGSLRDVEAAVRSGSVDVALTYDAFIAEDLEVTHLFTAPPHAVLSVHDPLAKLKKVSIEHLAKRPLLLLNSPDSAQYVLSLFTRSGFRPNVRHRSTSYELIRSSVALGLGASIFNIRPISNVTYSGESVVCRPLENANGGISSGVAVVTRKNDFLGARADAFIKQCQAFAKSPLTRNLIVT